MRFDKRENAVGQLIDSLSAGTLVVNAEYQRGAAWSLEQKQALVDSLFRGYPIPAFFLHLKERRDLLADDIARKYEIVDGQQRLIALRDYLRGEFTLLGAEDKRLSLPTSLRPLDAPWAGKSFEQLGAELQTRFLERHLDVFYVVPDRHDDEVRDLFIRLQKGTALTRQQVRDAWPGRLGPYVERLAGKMRRQPTQRLFDIIDQRGQRSEEEENDDFVHHRSACAQLLALFIPRERDPYHYASLSAAALDALYHEQTDFNAVGPVAQRFEEALRLTTAVFSELNRFNPKKRKYTKLQVFAVFLMFQDMTKSGGFKVTPKGIRELSALLADKWDSFHEPFKKRKLARSLVKDYYEAWRQHFAPERLVGVHLDSRRAFTAEQKAELRIAQSGRCAGCTNELEADEGEGDHFPVPYRDGGPTAVENGRLICAKCHPRGRPALEAAI